MSALTMAVQDSDSMEGLMVDSAVHGEDHAREDQGRDGVEASANGVAANSLMMALILEAQMSMVTMAPDQA